MFDALQAQVESNKQASSAQLRAPLWEQFAREVEDVTFFDHRTGSTFSYQHFSSAIKRFGSNGVTHFNKNLMQACFSNFDLADKAQEMESERAIYFYTQDDLQKFNSKRVPVAYLLRLAMIYGQHLSQAAQVQEMWLLVNPMLDFKILAADLTNFVKALADIVVHQTLRKVESISTFEDSAKVAIHQECLKYLNEAKTMIEPFISDFKAKLPEQLTFSQFASVVQSHCMNASQLRMKITQTEETKTSQQAAISQLSTIIISYLPKTEQMQKAQLVCRKWYSKFVPQVMEKIAFNDTPWIDRRFRLVYEGIEEDDGPLYLALVSETSLDLREKCGRTIYVSAGNSLKHKLFTWKIDKAGTLIAADGSEAMLAAHRTFVNDILGKEGTFVITTVYPGHENHWRLDRYGDLDRRRYIVVVTDQMCVKDNVDSSGWALTAELPNKEAQQSERQVQRDESSRYVYIKQPAVLTRELPKMPVWRLELV